MTIVRVLTFLFLLCAPALAEELDNNLTDNVNSRDDNNPKTQLLELPQHPITWNSYNIIATATAVVLVAAGLTALTALVLPLITYKICYLLGSCDKGFFTYVDRFIAADDNPRKNLQKRSLEYVGPILQALSAGYEKYGSPEIKKNSETITFYKKSGF